MEISINALVERVGDFLYERGALHYRFQAGLTHELPLSKLHRDFAELTRAETFQRVQQMLDSPRTDDQRKPGLKQLLHFLGDLMEDARAETAHETIASLLATAQVSNGTATLTLAEALARIPSEPQRERREVLETQSADTLWAQRGAWARRVEAGQAVAQELQFDSYLAMREQLTSLSVAPHLDGCSQLLEQTEPAYRDLLTYALKKLDPGFKPSAAHLHDVQRAAQAPWMLELFRKEDLLPAVTRWLSDLGFDPNAGGRLAFDSEDRPGKRTGAFVAELRVPDELRLVVLPRPGFDGYAELMRSFGWGLHRANASRAAPILERRLGDPAVPRAISALFENVLLDEDWHRRYLRMGQAQAREATRLFAFHQLLELRWKAALLPYAVQLCTRGPVDELADDYTERLRVALQVGAPRGRFLYDVRPQLKTLDALRGWALESVLHATLQHRFNEDFWRNPATGRWLADFSSHGQRDDADAVARAQGASGLSLPTVGARLVRVMAA